MLFLVLTFLFATAQPWKIRANNGEKTKTEINVEDVFYKAPEGWAQQIDIQDPDTLVEGAYSTLVYIRSNRNSDQRGIHPGMLGTYGITVEQIEWTLALLVQTAQNRPDKLNDPVWMENNFDLYLWNADALPREAEHDGKIRLTKYVVYQVKGSAVQTKKYNYALWQVPHEELKYTDLEAEKKKDLLRFKLTRQDILNGALKEQYSDQAKPLIWLERENIHEAIMQGTIAVQTENGDIQWFNVHRSNNYPYKRGFKAESQERYWYFREVDSPMGWGWQTENKIILSPYGSVAGDVDNLGLGKVIWLQEGSKVHLVILSDTGGAFQPNLQQLDWFIGLVHSKEDMLKKSSRLPSFVHAGILVAKQNP
jgi:membrane-bound lytic murein transglycosylase